MSKFNITLDRASGAYYAGEVITGTVTLRASGETCRSVLISCVGKARVHWHTGSGDNRRDYDGKKYFMESERTVWGNFYRTTVLDNAGANATFGGAFGDGDMYIPCLPSEGSNGSAMRLIVRACDYDWGKKDDNIGEVVIDAKELAMYGDAKTYNLTRNGKPEEGTVTLVGSFVPTSALTPGKNSTRSYVDQVQSSETLVLKVLRANGLRKADWFGNNDVYVQVWRAPEDLPSPPPPGKKLPEPDKKIKLPNETMTFKFAFPTRTSAPGSAAFRYGDHAYIAYYIKAEIDKKGWRNPSMKFPITILPIRPAPKLALLSPVLVDDEDQVKKCKICCFACCEAGSVQLKFKCNRRAFAPGQRVTIDGTSVINNSSVDLRIHVVLRQHTRLSTTYGGNTTTGKQSFHLGSTSVDSGTEKILDGMPIQIPAVPPSFFGGKGSPIGSSDPLTYTYDISFRVQVPNGNTVKIDLPVLISALPPKDSAIEAAPSASLVGLTDAFSIKNNAVLDDVPCDTVPPITGLEDGNGELKPSAAGAVNIYEPEDAGSSAHAYSYEPEIVVFPSYQPTETQTPSVDNSLANADVDHDEAYNILIEKMKTEYNSREAVDKWIKEYPSAAASLTSDEFAGALKNVQFSLEQPTVARELTSGIGSGSLTTDHIIASIEACPFSKMEIVRVMAPYVSDPQNKDAVLQKLYSFEREEASNLF